MSIDRTAKDHLKSFVERIERLQEEKKCLADDIADVYAEAKGNGFDVKALRAVISLRKQDKDKRAEHEAILATYMQALGMLPPDEAPEEAAAAHVARVEEKRKRRRAQADLAVDSEVPA